MLCEHETLWLCAIPFQEEKKKHCQSAAVTTGQILIADQVNAHAGCLVAASWNSQIYLGVCSI